MPQFNRPSLWDLTRAAGDVSGRFLANDDCRIALGALEQNSCLSQTTEELRGKNILVRGSGQLTAVLSLIEFDGLANRIVLCPPDLDPTYLAHVIGVAEIDAVVSDGPTPEPEIAGVDCFIVCRPDIRLPRVAHSERAATEWVMFTSGTTGRPKMVAHTLPGLTGPVRSGGPSTNDAVWSTFYDIRRYGGLQMLLRALVGGGSMVLSSAKEPLGDFFARASRYGVTHISGTPSHWRRAIMSPDIDRLSPGYIRLSGEVADQAILDRLKHQFPHARIAHAFASTEAGVAFDVTDGHAGFPAQLIDGGGGAVDMRIEDGSLRIRSIRTAGRYLGDLAVPLMDADGFVDTGDLVERRDDRYHFVGRREGIINVGGLKVHPEEVEAVINKHPAVLMSLVRAQRNPITGAVVVADVVTKSTSDISQMDGTMEPESIKQEILATCRRTLLAHKVPTVVRFVPSLTIAASGKVARVRG